MYKNFFKRLFDIILALLALPFWFIILIVIAPCIYFPDKGSIFYNAQRVGENGKIFKMYKFRSMKMNVPDIRNKDGSTFNAKNDLRLTKIGKFLRNTSLDETPQILNVIKGDMSFIGPRPDLPEMLNQYTGYERKKLSVKPGLTGFNQAFYRNTNDLVARFKNDIYYTENVSMRLDIKIFIKTMFVVLMRENVYRNK